MNNSYIVDGKVARAKIAADIEYRRLSRNDIEQLCKDPQISGAFFGLNYADKLPKQKWNKNYLNRLSCAVVAESFNRDYLLHLYEVAEFLSKSKFKKNIVKYIIIVFLIIVGIFVLNVLKGGIK